MILLANYINKNSNRILFLFFLLFLAVGIFTYKDYGISIDEEFHRFSGFYWLNYVLSFTPFDAFNNEVLNKLNDISGFTLPNPKNYPVYGVIFDLPAAFIETLFKIEDSKNYYHFRHFLTFLIFFISSIFFYKLLFNRFSNFNVSIVGTLFYIISPRIYGNSFYNNKDIIFLSLITIALYFCFKNIDKLCFKNIIFFSLFAALATSARVLGVFIPISFFLIYFFSILDGKYKFESAYKILFFLTIYFIFLIIFWPYLWESPIENFVHSLKLFSKYTLGIKMLFNGSYISSKFLPYSYIPTWIGLTTPVVYLFLFLLGSFYILKRIFFRFLNIKENSIHHELWRGKNEKKDLYIFLNFFGILFYLIFANVVLYTGWRQIYFLNIFIIYISTYMFYIFFLNLKSYKKKLFLNFSVFLFLIFMGINLVVYHPYQNIYFNILATKNLKKNMEIDYWGLSGMEFLKNILKREPYKKSINIGVASFLPLERSLSILDKNNRKKINMVGQNYELADYIFNSNISEVDKNVNNKYNIPKNFKKIEELIINNTKVFEIYKNTID